MTELLRLDGVTASYGKMRVLHGVSLAVPERSVVALLGPNGAGKTTTLRVIVGLHRERNGRLQFAGRPIERLRADEIVRRGISMVPERREIFTELTVAENLELGAYTRRDRHAVGADLATVYGLFPDLAGRRRLSAGSLSGGQQQMLAIGRALMAKPKLLLLDEPSLGLAPVLVHEMFRAIRRIGSTGTSMVIVEQNAQMALQIASYGYVLEHGRIVLAGQAAELVRDDRVRRSYLGQI